VVRTGKRTGNKAHVARENEHSWSTPFEKLSDIFGEVCETKTEAIRRHRPSCSWGLEDDDVGAPPERIG
jgi:hypothetical protein